MSNNSTNVFDYLEWRGDLSLQQSSFNEIDALILSILSYLDFSISEKSQCMAISDAMGKINALPSKVKLNGPSIIMPSVLELGNQVSQAARFSEMQVYKYVSIIDESKEMQFSATTFLLPDNTAFLSFRGTDNSLIGWKEDLNMSFIDGIPAQLEAQNYAESVLRDSNRPVRLGGHSKGGNLAIWAAANLSSTAKRYLIEVFSNDGPGFSKEFLASNNYSQIRAKVTSFVPESSIVGVLMEHDDYITICSSSPSIFQHDPFSWKVLGNHFMYKEKRTLSGKQMERVVNSWIRSMSDTERKELVENLYDIFSSSDAKTLNDFDKAKIKSLFMMQKTFRDMEFTKQKQLILSLSKIFFNSEIFINQDFLAQVGIPFKGKREIHS